MHGTEANAVSSLRDACGARRDTSGARELLGVWTPKFAGEELVEAVRWAEKSQGKLGPSQRVTFFPEVFLSGDERALEAWPAIQELEPTPSRRHVSPRRVSQFERILWWPSKYLRDLPGPARVLHVWVRCKIARKAKFDDACEHLGWSRATAYRARDKALAAIAMGLTAENIERGEH